MQRREIYMENEISHPGDFEYIPEDHPEDMVDFEDDGQPDEYTEWQDYMGGDDWDHGQYDCDPYE